MKLIYKARDITEAHIVAGLLNANGIEAHVSGHYLQGGIGELATMDFSNVHVADEDIALARKLIAEYEGSQDKPDTNNDDNNSGITHRLLIAISAVLIIIFIYFLATS